MYEKGRYEYTCADYGDNGNPFGCYLYWITDFFYSLRQRTASLILIVHSNNLYLRPFSRSIIPLDGLTTIISAAYFQTYMSDFELPAYAKPKRPNLFTSRSAFFSAIKFTFFWLANTPSNNPRYAATAFAYFSQQPVARKTCLPFCA